MRKHEYTSASTHEQLNKLLAESKGAKKAAACSDAAAIKRTVRLNIRKSRLQQGGRRG